MARNLVRIILHTSFLKKRYLKKEGTGLEGKSQQLAEEGGVWLRLGRRNLSEVGKR